MQRAVAGLASVPYGLWYVSPLLVAIMADWDDEAAAAGPVAVEEDMVPPTADMPEVHLFGKWSCEDVQVPDISLQVSC